MPSPSTVGGPSTMKRRALAFCASLLLVALVPGSTLAISPTSNLDQYNDPAMPLTYFVGSTSDLAQTFTVGKSGLLRGVDLYLSLVGLTASIEATASGHPTGSALASGSGTVSATPGWVHFAFPTPLSVLKDSVYAIVFNTGDSGKWYGSTDTYPGGQALMAASPWNTLGDAPDFAFRTYVDTVGTQLLWDKPQIIGGTTTPLTLTETMTYANGVEASHYTALLASWPTWFTPTGLTCSDTASKINQTDCTLTNLEDGFGSLIPASASGDILTFTVTGTAAPVTSAIGTSSDAGGNACINYLNYLDETPLCGDGLAVVDVIAAAPALTLVKTADKATYTAGDTVTYTYTIHNTGNVALTTFSVTDDKTTVNCTGAVSSLAAGASTTCTATYLTTTADGVAGSATNHATAHAVYGETTYDSNPDSVTVTVVPVPATAAPATAAPVTPAPATPAPVTPAPTRAATPPPTSTGSGSSSNDSGAMMWFLPVGLIAFLGALVLAFTRTRRRIA